MALAKWVLPVPGRAEENDGLGWDHPMFFREVPLGQGQDDPPLHNLLGRLRLGDGLPQFFADGLSPHLIQDILPLIGQIFRQGLIRIFEKIDARHPQAHIPAELFRQEPFMLQDLGPQVRGHLRIKFTAADLKDRIATHLWGHGLS